MNCTQTTCRLGEWKIEAIDGKDRQVRRCIVCGRIAATATIPEPENAADKMLREHVSLICPLHRRPGCACG
jgi:hypothetical protein